MASIAHEGNPRITPDLVVTGTLDGDIFLTPQPGDGVPQAPQENPPEPGEPNFSPEQSGPIKFVFPADDLDNITFRFGNDYNTLGTSSVSGSSTAVAPNEDFLEYSRHNNTDVYGLIRHLHTFRTTNSSGFMVDPVRVDEFFKSFWNSSGAINSPFHNGLQISVSGRLIARTGNPIAGPAIGFKKDVTVNNFSGYAFLYDSVAGNCKLCFYDQQPLWTFGEILATMSTVPGLNQFLWCSYISADNVSEVSASINGLVYGTNGSTVLESVSVDSGLPATEEYFKSNPYVGWINVASGINGSGNSEDSFNWDLVTCNQVITG